MKFNIAAKILFIGLLALSATNLWTQEASAQLSRTVLLICRFAPEAVFSAEQKQLLMESMVIRLGSSSPDVVIRSFPDLGLAMDTDLDKVAGLSGMDAWLDARISGNMESATISFQAKDLQKGINFFAHDISARIDSRFRNAFAGLWSPIMQKIAETIHPVLLQGTVRFSGLQGTTIRFDGNEAVRISEGGSIEITATTPASHQYEAWLPGYRSWRGTVFLEGSIEIQLTPVSVVPFSAELALEWLSYPSARLSWGVIPDILDIDIGAVFYTFGIMPSYPTDPNPSLFHDYHLINFLVGARWYPLEHRYAFRPWFGIGFQARLLTAPTVQFDPISPAGFYTQFGFSYDIIPELAVFFDLLPRFTFSNDTSSAFESLALGNAKNDGVNATAAIGPILFEPWHFMVGVRFQPWATPAATVSTPTEKNDLNSLLVKRSFLVRQLEQEEKNYETQKVFGVVSLGIGLVGAVLAVYGAVDGNTSYQTLYQGGADASAVTAARARVSTDATLLWVGLSLTGLGLTAGPLLLFSDPTTITRTAVVEIEQSIENAKTAGGTP